MRDIIIWELRRRRSAIIWWGLGSVLLSILILALYPSIRDQAHQLNQVINQLPQGLRGLKTGGAQTVDVADPVAFLNSQLFYATLPILWIILAITRGASILGREEQTKTLELLLARPVRRGGLLLGKALSFAIEFIIVAGVTLAAIIVAAPLCSLHVGWWHLFVTTAFTALFAFSFGLIAFSLEAASSLTKRAATAVAVFIGFGGYILASLSGLTDWLKGPAKFAPYHYFEPTALLRGNSVHGLDIYLIGVLVVCAAVAYFGFRHRDIA